MLYTVLNKMYSFGIIKPLAFAGQSCLQFNIKIVSKFDIVQLIPSHVRPFPVNPARHAHMKLPAVSVQLAFVAHVCLGWASPGRVLHSSMFVQMVPFPV